MDQPVSGRKQRLHAVLLAGGSGTRFWPYSRQDRPKQFLALAGRDSLLRATWKRVRKLAPISRVWVVAPARLADAVRAELPQLRDDRLLLEPSPRDTAPAIALAAHAVAEADRGATMAIFPTDHTVEDRTRFERSVRDAVDEAAGGALVCLGIRPDRPATGFGYLQCARSPDGARAVRVARFVEKPDAATARRYLRSKRYLWNAGMFVWLPSAFLEELRRTAPGVYGPVARFRAGERSAWSRAERKSVDYAVMEHARDVRVVPLDAGWDDVGSWDAAARLRPETGEDAGARILVDSPGSAIFDGRRVVALVDVPDVVVVDTEDAVLVVSRRSAERVREVVERLQGGRKGLL